jgi:hypothetical protein
MFPVRSDLQTCRKQHPHLSCGWKIRMTLLPINPTRLSPQRDAVNPLPALVEILRPLPINQTDFYLDGPNRVFWVAFFDSVVAACVQAFMPIFFAYRSRCPVGSIGRRSCSKGGPADAFSLLLFALHVSNALGQWWKQLRKGRVRQCCGSCGKIFIQVFLDSGEPGWLRRRKVFFLAFTFNKPK